MPLASTDKRCEQHYFLTVKLFEDKITDLFFGIFYHFFTRFVAVSIADSSKK